MKIIKYPLDGYYITSKMFIYEASTLIWKTPYVEKHGTTILCLQHDTTIFNVHLKEREEIQVSTMFISW